MKPLFVIPARGGSKGIPGKNIKLLGGKPLICHTIEAAREAAAALGVPDTNICVSTDDPSIASVAADCGLQVPFMRPAELASDTAASSDVVRHAMNYHLAAGTEFDTVVLLQPTSPFRTAADILGALKLYGDDVDMVVSVAPAKSNPYYTCMEEDSDGLLQVSKGDGRYTRRQDAPAVYELNGAVYVINPASLAAKPMSAFSRRRKYEMPQSRSLDLDTLLDWQLAELIIEADKKQR